MLSLLLLALSASDPIVYTIRAPAPETHLAELQARIPTEGHASLELMLPVWSPGYYALGDYARDVKAISARTPAGAALAVEHPKPNHWVVATQGAETVVLDYELVCKSRFVTGSWVGTDCAVINGPSTFITPVEHAGRAYEVDLELPAAWKQSISSLDAAADGKPDHYRAPDYDVLIDSPLVAGTLSLHEFRVGDTLHVLADFGELGQWDGQAVAGKLGAIVAEHRRFLGELPFPRYVFLNAMRGGAGGLEHLNSTLLSSAPAPKTAEVSLGWLKYVSHEYFHAINVKRLRPVELGPFDYEKLPSTPSLWIAEGLTSYYGDLAVTRAGLGSLQDWLDGMSGFIRSVQTTPGRLVQTLEQASLGAGVSSSSGVGGDPRTTISYYEKGPLVGWLLDARIRRATNDARSLDDVMRLAYRRYSGERGFSAAEFEATAAEVAGTDLAAFFQKTLRTTEELDYSEALEWFGLRFAEPGAADPRKAWKLETRASAADPHLARLVSGRAGAAGR
jgi:predicted metalloprotease with PDZ domain